MACERVCVCGWSAADTSSMASAGPSTAACSAELGSGCGMRRAAEASSSWLVNEWKRRGLIDHDPTDAEIDSVMHSSYFWRRNKNRPSKTPASPSMEAEADTNWLARRNKKSCRNKCGLRRERSASIERVESWSVSIASAMLDVQGRLPKPPQLLKLDREVKPQQAARALVYLTLYDLSPCWNVINHHVGMGMYHSGIELAASAESEGTEFTFDHHAGRSSGVAWHVPYYADRKRDAELPLRTRRLLGRSPLALQEALQLLLDMAPSWLSSQCAARPPRRRHALARARVWMGLESACNAASHPPRVYISLSPLPPCAGTTCSTATATTGATRPPPRSASRRSRGGSTARRAASASCAACPPRAPTATHSSWQLCVTTATTSSPRP